jgi:ArsR family transcriptional regulator
MEAFNQVALALSDPIRLQILDLLVVGREGACCSPENPDAPNGVCACDLLLQLDLAPSRLSYHMKELREAGLTREQKRGRWIYYTLHQETLAAFLQTVQTRYLRPAEGQSQPVPAETRELSGEAV